MIQLQRMSGKSFPDSIMAVKKEEQKKVEV